VADKNFQIKNGLTVGTTERISSAGVFTGSLASANTATTQSASDNSTKIATTAYVDTAVTGLIDSAPSNLNTLNELAAAMNDNASFFSTVLPLSGGTMTGALIVTDGSTSAPSIANSGDTNTGIYFPADDNLGLVVGGSRKLLANSTGITVNNGDLIVDTDKLVVDISTGRVGIGTQTPSSHLHISSASSPTLRLTDTTNTMQALYYAQDANAHLGTYSNHPLIFDTNSTQRMQITAAGLVAIGTGAYTPNHLLNIQAETTSGKAQIEFRNTQAGTQIGMPANVNAIATYLGDTERMRVTSSGYVGIGTTAPTARLHISGNSDTSDEDCQLIIDDVDGSAGSRIPSIQFRSNTGGTVTNQGRIRATDTQGMVISSSSAQGDDLVITSSGVGIGTTSPAALLEITGTGDAIRVESTNSGAGGAQVDLLHFTGSPADDDIHGSINFGGYYSGSSSAYGSAIKSVWSDVSAKEAKLEFYTRDDSDFTSRMTIDKDGHIDVESGNIYLTGSNDRRIKLSDSGIAGISDSNNTVHIRGDNDYMKLMAAGNGGFIFEENGSERFRINPTGSSKLTDTGIEVYNDIYSGSGGSRGAGYFRFLTDGAGGAEQSVAQIYMEQGSGDGAARKCNMYFQVADNASPTTAMTIENNKSVTTAQHLNVSGASNASYAKLNVAGGIRFTHSPASAAGLNVVGQYSFSNSNTDNACGSVYYKMFMVNFYHNNGHSQCLFLANGGGGVGYGFTVIEPGSNTIRTGNTDFSFTTVGSSPNTFRVKVGYGNGNLTVNRTSGTGSYQVSVGVLNGG